MINEEIESQNLLFMTQDAEGANAVNSMANLRATHTNVMAGCLRWAHSS